MSLFATTPETTHGWNHWRIARDGDPTALDLFSRHYSRRSYADGRERQLIVGPGHRLVLISHDDTALFVWRVMTWTMDGQHGVCCSVFRNEGPALSSTLVREADAIADKHWPHIARHYTYVAPGRIRSTNPGACFRIAGWTRCGWTKGGHGRDQLVILERATR